MDENPLGNRKNIVHKDGRALDIFSNEIKIQAVGLSGYQVVGIRLSEHQVGFPDTLVC